MERELAPILHDILQSIERIEIVTSGMTLETFSADWHELHRSARNRDHLRSRAPDSRAAEGQTTRNPLAAGNGNWERPAP
jgi:hypothetical protein